MHKWNVIKQDTSIKYKKHLLIFQYILVYYKQLNALSNFLSLVFTVNILVLILKLICTGCNTFEWISSFNWWRYIYQMVTWKRQTTHFLVTGFKSSQASSNYRKCYCFFHNFLSRDRNFLKFNFRLNLPVMIWNL